MADIVSKSNVLSVNIEFANSIGPNNHPTPSLCMGIVLINTWAFIRANIVITWIDRL